VDSSFGNDVGVEAVAKIDGVDVIAFKVRVPKPNQDVSVRTTNGKDKPHRLKRWVAT